MDGRGLSSAVVLVMSQVLHEDAMSLQVSPKAPARVVSTGLDEARGVSRAARPRNEARDESTSFGVACQDVLDEVRQRMASRGFSWE
jgi:hypothetical protein